MRNECLGQDFSIFFGKLVHAVEPRTGRVKRPMLKGYRESIRRFTFPLQKSALSDLEKKSHSPTSLITAQLFSQFTVNTNIHNHVQRTKIHTQGNSSKGRAL